MTAPQQRPPRSRLRVLFPFVGDSIGGSHVSAATLAEALADDIEPVVAVHRPGALLSWLADRGLTACTAPAVPLPMRRSLAATALRALGSKHPLVRFLRRHRIDIVHTHDARMHRAWGWAAMRAGLPHVWHQRTPLRSPRAAHDARHAAAFVTISEHARQALSPPLRSRAAVIHNPVATPKDLPARATLRAALLADIGLPADSDAALIAFVANFDNRKRPGTFVDAVACLARSGANAVGIMVGEARPPLGDEVAKRIERTGLGDRVVLLGARFPVEPILGGCDALIAPAVDEAFGRVLVEAMAVGTPVIAADDGAHREIVRHGETGLLVPPDDAAALARAVARLLHEPALAAALRHAGVRTAARFSVGAHVAAVTDLYRRVAPAPTTG